MVDLGGIEPPSGPPSHRRDYSNTLWAAGNPQPDRTVLLDPHAMETGPKPERNGGCPASIRVAAPYGSHATHSTTPGCGANSRRNAGGLAGFPPACPPGKSRRSTPQFRTAILSDPVRGFGRFLLPPAGEKPGIATVSTALQVCPRTGRSRSPALPPHPNPSSSIAQGLHPCPACRPGRPPSQHIPRMGGVGRRGGGDCSLAAQRQMCNRVGSFRCSSHFNRA